MVASSDDRRDARAGCARLAWGGPPLRRRNDYAVSRFAAGLIPRVREAGGVDAGRRTMNCAARRWRRVMPTTRGLADEGERMPMNPLAELPPVCFTTHRAAPAGGRSVAWLPGLRSRRRRWRCASRLQGAGTYAALDVATYRVDPGDRRLSGPREAKLTLQRRQCCAPAMALLRRAVGRLSPRSATRCRAHRCARRPIPVRRCRVAGLVSAMPTPTARSRRRY